MKYNDIVAHLHQIHKEDVMRITLSVIKADVGSIGGHTQPSERMMEAVREEVAGAVDRGLIIGPCLAESDSTDQICVVLPCDAGFRIEPNHVGQHHADGRPVDNAMPRSQRV